MPPYADPVPSRPRLTVVLVATVWGTIGLIVREVELPAVAIAFARVAVGGLGLAIVSSVMAGRGNHGRARPFDHRPVRTLVSGALLAVHWVAMLAAFQRAPIGTVLLVVYLAPVLVALGAPRLIGERVAPVVVVALGPALAGTALVVGPGAEGVAATGLGLAGVASVTYAALALVNKTLVGHYGGLRLAMIEQAVAAAVLAPFAASVSWGPPRGAWAWLVVLGLVHTAGGLALFLDALGRIPATQAAILAQLEPVAAFGFAWAVLGEEPGLATAIGGLLVVGAGAMVVRAGTDRSVMSPEVAGATG